jgi:hypothetical protein
MSIKEYKKFLYADVTTNHSCPGVYGWSSELLFPIRSTPFLKQLGRFLKCLAEREGGESEAFVLVAGSLFALHKLPPQEQKAREASGLAPKLRPVNVGCALLKWIFKVAMRSKQAKRAASDLRPIQMGLSAKHGVDTVAHLYRALLEKGYLVLTTDFTNGFNAFLRQAMLDAVNRKCGGLNGLFNKFYGLDAVCFMKADGVLLEIRSEEGSRMGCVLGSFGFNLTVDDVYKAVAARFPGAVTKALTDDYTMGLPPISRKPVSVNEQESKGGGGRSAQETEVEEAFRVTAGEGALGEGGDRTSSDIDEVASSKAECKGGERQRARGEAEQEQAGGRVKEAAVEAAFHATAGEGAYGEGGLSCNGESESAGVESKSPVQEREAMEPGAAGEAKAEAKGGSSECEVLEAAAVAMHQDEVRISHEVDGSGVVSVAATVGAEEHAGAQAEDMEWERAIAEGDGEVCLDLEVSGEGKVCCKVSLRELGEHIPDTFRAARFFHEVKREAMLRCGLELNFSKCNVLVPEDQPMCPPHLLPKGVSVTREGIRLAGAPLGTDAFCRSFVMDKINEIGVKVKEVRKLVSHRYGPQVGYALMQKCVSRAAAFLLQVTPPALTIEAAQRLDDVMAEAALHLITPPSMAVPPECSAGRMAAARHLLFMPTRLKGVGIGSAVQTAQVAFYASVAACQAHDEDFRAHRDGMKRFAAEAHARVVRAVMGERWEQEEAEEKESGGAFRVELAQVKQLARWRRSARRYLEVSNPNSLVEGDFCVSIYNENPALKLQKKLSAMAQEMAHHRHMSQFSASDEKADITDDDRVATFARSQSSRVFRAQLSCRRNRFDGILWATWVRFMLRLPQCPHLGNLESRPHLPHAYATEVCQCEHSRGQCRAEGERVLDLHGNHANSTCPAVARARYKRHTLLRQICAILEKKAGLSVKEEPSTHDLLLRLFTPLQCRLMFHKYPSKQHLKEVEELLVLMRAAGKPRIPPAEKKKLLSKIDADLRLMQSSMKGKCYEVKEKDRQGLRVDSETFDQHSGATRWSDVTSVHSMCKSYRRAEIARTELNIKAFLDGIPEKDWPHLEGARAAKAEKDKRALYGQMAMVGRRQHLHGLRSQEPQFVPLVITTHGEMGLAMIAHQEWVTGVYRDKVVQEGLDHPREDGLSSEQLTASFRTEFRVGVQVAVAKGLAQMLAEAGQPMGF